MAIYISSRNTYSVTVGWSSHSSLVSTYNIEVFAGTSASGTKVFSSYGISKSTFSMYCNGLSANSTYTVKLYSRNSSNSTIKVENITFGTPPNAITSCYASSITTSSFYANWTTPPNGAGYYRITVTQGGYTVLNTTTYSTSYYVSGLSSGTQYYVSITPVGDYDGYSGSAGSFYATTTAIVYPPSSMGTIYVNSLSSQATISWNSVSGADRYNVEIYDGTSTSGTRVDYSYGLTSTSYTTYALQAGRPYTVKAYANNSAGNGGFNTTTFYTTIPVIGAYSTSSTSDSISFSWGGVSGASGYTVEVREGSSIGTRIVYANTTSTSYSVYNLKPATPYWVNVYAYSSYVNGSNRATTITTLNAPPVAPSNFSISSRLSNGFTCSWSSVSGATGYNLEAYHANTGQYIGNVRTTGTSATITGMNEYVAYQLKLYAYNNEGNGSPAYINGTTLDVTAPNVSINSVQTEGKMYISWSANDSHSGLRSASKFAVSISNRNGSTYYHKAYTDNYYYTFIDDGNGLEFVNGATYYMRVIAYDADNNTSASTSGMVTYRNARPANWSWHTEKVKGQPIKVTATEWNSLCTRINQFRQYKGFSNYNFTTVVTGNIITASVYNEARNAISSMTTTNLPSTVSVGTKITADLLNGLVTAMNGIT